MKTKSFSLIIILLTSLNFYAQNIDSLLSQIIFPSPQAAALARYGEYPVGHSSGVPNISIPLYDIKLGNYKLPISISCFGY